MSGSASPSRRWAATALYWVVSGTAAVLVGAGLVELVDAPPIAGGIAAVTVAVMAGRYADAMPWHRR